MANYTIKWKTLRKAGLILVFVECEDSERPALVTFETRANARKFLRDLNARGVEWLVSPPEVAANLEKKSPKKFRIMADAENNSNLFWDNFDRMLPAIRRRFRRSDTIQVTPEEWAKIQKIPGFADGPEYAKAALINLDEK